MRRIGLLAATALLGLSAPVIAQVSVGIGIGLPSVRIGIRLGGYPDLVAIPGYPVYYASGLDSNFFFYDGLYWVLSDDGWYSSSWYDGPWDFVDPAYVPLYVLRVPVRYYRRPPSYFRGWDQAGPPRWGDHFGRDWERRRTGWDQWNRSAVPARAPLPAYQREYSGSRYPRPEQQRDLQNRNYRYQPQESRQPTQSRPQAQPRPEVQPQSPRSSSPVQPRQPQQEQAPRREQRQQPEQRRQPEQRGQPEQRPQQQQRAQPEQRPQPREPQASRQAPQRPDTQSDRRQDKAPDRKEQKDRDRDAPRDR